MGFLGTASERDTYEPGDRVRCVNASGTELVEGQEYVVTRGGTHTIAVDGVTSFQYAYRFEPVQ